MFCPKCGRELPEGSKFCPECGSPLTSKVESQTHATEASAASNAVNASVAGAKKTRKPLIIGGVAVVAVAAIVGIVFLVTNALGGADKLVNGKYIFENNFVYGMSYEVYKEDGKQKIDIGYAEDANGISTVYCSGTFVEDGENDQGIIWKLVPDEEYEDLLFIWNLIPEEEYEDNFANTTIRFQFPQDYAEGNVDGRWYLEQTTVNSEGTSETMFSIMEFKERSLAVVSAYGVGALDSGLGVQDVLDNEAYEKEDIPEGKFFNMSSIDSTVEFMAYDNWLNVSDEGNGAYSVELISQDNESTITDHIEWMDINITPEE